MIYYGNEEALDVTQPTGEDDSNIELFESDEWSDYGDEDTGMGSPTGEDI